MIADRDLRIKRETYSTPWLTDTIWAAAKRSAPTPTSCRRRRRSRTITCRFSPPASRRSTSSTSYEPWHTQRDTLDAVSARSLQIVGDTVVAAMPSIEARLLK